MITIDNIEKFKINNSTKLSLCVLFFADLVDEDQQKYNPDMEKKINRVYDTIVNKSLDCFTQKHSVDDKKQSLNMLVMLERCKDAWIQQSNSIKKMNKNN